MRAAALAQLKKELQHCSPGELLRLCLRLSKFKKENKELLTYLLFWANDEAGYVETIKTEIDGQFLDINTKGFFYIKKSVRKILRTLKTYVRYSGNKETEVELLLHFCQRLGALDSSIRSNVALSNLYERQLALIRRKVALLHEDLQYDYGMALENLIPAPRPKSS